MSSLSGETPHSIYPDDPLEPSSSSDSDSIDKEAQRGAYNWDPFERYREFYREKWQVEEEQLSSEAEEMFERFVHNYEKYKAKDKVGVPFREEMRRSVPSFKFDAARDRKFFVGYDEEGNEVRYKDEQYYLKRIRQSEVLEYMEACRESMKKMDEQVKREEEAEKKRQSDNGKNGKDTNAVEKEDISYVGKKQGLWWKNGFKGMNVELKKKVEKDGEVKYTVRNKARKSRKSRGLLDNTNDKEERFTGEKTTTKIRKKMAVKEEKRPVNEDAIDKALRIATKKLKMADYSRLETDVAGDRSDGGSFVKRPVFEKLWSSGSQIDAGEEICNRGELESAYAGKFLSEEEPDTQTRNGNMCYKNNDNKEGTEDEDDNKGDEETYTGFREEEEEEDAFNVDRNDTDNETDSLFEKLKFPMCFPQPNPKDNDVKEANIYYDTEEDDETGEMYGYEIEAQEKRKKKKKKGKEEDETKEEEEEEKVKSEITFRHSLKFKEEEEERETEEARLKALHDLDDVDRAIELLLRDIEGGGTSDEEESEME